MSAPPSIWTLKANGRTGRFTLLLNDVCVMERPSSAACIGYACEQGTDLDVIEVAGECESLAVFRASHQEAERRRAAVAEARTKITAIRAGLPAECRERPVVEVGRVVRACGLEGVRK